MPVSLVSNKYTLKQWKFPGGEVGVKLEPKDEPDTVDFNRFDVTGIVTSDDFFTLIMGVNALRNLNVEPEKIFVFMPYFPYARQDRVCHEGESDSLYVYVTALGTIVHDIASFVTGDLHSQVSFEYLKALFGTKLLVESQFRIVTIAQNLDKELPMFDAVVAPDAGAAEKANKIQVGSTHVQLTKTRMKSIVVTSISDDQRDTIVGTACIFDDICDGGATFIAAGEVLRDTQPRMTSLNLYVTHGIFSQGVDKLLEIFDNIYVYNLMSADPQVAQKVKVI